MEINQTRIVYGYIIQGGGDNCFSLVNISSLSLLYVYSFYPLFVVKLASV